MKKVVLLGLVAMGSLTLNSCNELQQVLASTQNGSSSGFNIASGLKQALELGVSNGVDGTHFATRRVAKGR